MLLCSGSLIHCLLWYAFAWCDLCFALCQPLLYNAAMQSSPTGKMRSLQQCCDITCRLTQWAHFGQLTDLDAGATADACTPCWASWPKFYIQIRIPFNPLCPPPSSWDEATGTNAWKCPFLENNFTPSQEINIMLGKGWDNHQSWGVVWHTAHTQDKIFNPISLQAKNQMLDILCEATVDVFLSRFCCRPAGDLNHPEEWEEDPEKMVSRSIWSFACNFVCLSLC